MAKQRRAGTRPAPPGPRKPKVRRQKTEGRARRPPEARRRPADQQPPKPQPPRAGYVEAVALYERALEALRAHDYATAADLLRSVLTGYPEEKELHERVVLYLNICQRQAAPATPSNTEECLYAATLALNAGNLELALAHISRAIATDPDCDHAHYMRGVALVERGEFAEALSSLARAVEINPENRALIRQDPDLEALRVDKGVRQAVETLLAAPRHERRRTSSRSRLSK